MDGSHWEMRKLTSGMQLEQLKIALFTVFMIVTSGETHQKKCSVHTAHDGATEFTNADSRR